jgi:hypothetical protein
MGAGVLEGIQLPIDDRDGHRAAAVVVYAEQGSLRICQAV